MRSSALLASLATILATTTTVSALGINCRGSGLCPLATWDNKAPESVIQILRDALYQSTAPASTPYNSGDHVICVSNTLSVNVSLPIPDPTGLTKGGSFTLAGNIKDGGICLFPQSLRAGPVTLGDIRKMADALLEHGCGTCGSIPVHLVDQGSNDPAPGILTFNYVKNPYCVGNCLSAMGTANDTLTAGIGKRDGQGDPLSSVQSMRVRSAKFAGLTTDAGEKETRGWIGWLMRR